MGAVQSANKSQQTIDLIFFRQILVVMGGFSLDTLNLESKSELLSTSSFSRPLCAGVVCFVIRCSLGFAMGFTHIHGDGVHHRWCHETCICRRRRRYCYISTKHGLRSLYAGRICTGTCRASIYQAFATVACPEAHCSGSYCCGHCAAITFSRASRTLNFI